jgi:hypothetical protein
MKECKTLKREGINIEDIDPQLIEKVENHPLRQMRLQAIEKGKEFRKWWKVLREEAVSFGSNPVDYLKVILPGGAEIPDLPVGVDSYQGVQVRKAIYFFRDGWLVWKYKCKDFYNKEEEENTNEQGTNSNTSILSGVRNGESTNEPIRVRETRGYGISGRSEGPTRDQAKRVEQVLSHTFN